MKLPKVQLDNPTTPVSSVQKENKVDALEVGLDNFFEVELVQVDEEFRKPGFKAWGNGRDWRRPKARDGGWVRIWPLCNEDRLDGNNNVSVSGNSGPNKMGVKAMVNKVRF